MNAIFEIFVIVVYLVSTTPSPRHYLNLVIISIFLKEVLGT